MHSVVPAAGASVAARGTIRYPLDRLGARLAVRRVTPGVRAVLKAAAADGTTRVDLPGQLATWPIVHARGSVQDGFVALAGRMPPAAVVVRGGIRPAAVRAIEREAEALQAIGRLDLGAVEPAFARLVPRPLVAGWAGPIRYLVESLLPGRPIDIRRVDPTFRRATIAAALAAIGRLHTATRSVARVGPGDVDRWVHRRVDIVADLLHATGWRGLADATLPSLRWTLEDALRDRPLAVARIHGDFWTGNLVFLDDPSSRGTPIVTGIVDWDSSLPRELPFQDTLHVVLYAEKLVARRSLGEVVAVASDSPSRLGTLVGEGIAGLTPRQRVLLYWLRQVEANVERDAAVARRSRWVERNIVAVLDRDWDRD